MSSFGTRPRLLDLFCGAGIGAEGYMRAGFEVIGVDKDPQRYRGDDFFQCDAFEYLLALLETGWAHDSLPVHAIHASPPCQFATDYQRTGLVGAHANLIPETRRLLRKVGLPYVIENVEKAAEHLIEPVMLCGSMFEPPLDVKRHRLFETWGFHWLPNGGHAYPLACRHKLWAPRFPAATNRQPMSRCTVEVGVRRIPLETQKRAMGVDWNVTREELSLGIPPAYTELIGHQLLAHLRQPASEVASGV